jgi:hypothetical protein
MLIAMAHGATPNQSETVTADEALKDLMDATGIAQNVDISQAVRRYTDIEIITGSSELSRPLKLACSIVFATTRLKMQVRSPTSAPQQSASCSVASRPLEFSSFSFRTQCATI